VLAEARFSKRYKPFRKSGAKRLHDAGIAFRQKRGQPDLLPPFKQKEITS
jgi:hypothetical protein